MSVAVNRFYKAGNDFYKEVSFFDVDAFSECAKLCAEKVRKGDEIRVSGRLKQNRWQAQDGTNRSQVVIIADYVEFKSKSAAREAPGEPGVEF
jgi:single-strand DNA-binding protein